MSYAIIEIAGKQFKVKPEDTITVTGDFGKETTQVPAKILMLNNGDINVGSPHLDTNCSLEVIRVEKGEKIRVATYKAKSRRRRVIGHRQFETVFKVLDWETSAKKTKAPAKAKKEA